MSSTSLKRTKLVKTRSNGEWSSIPFGTDGLLVDMLSLLDLEELLKLGGNHYVDIDLSENITTIREWYFSQSLNNNIVPSKENADIDNITSYSCLIVIELSTLTILRLIVTEDGKFLIDSESLQNHIIADTVAGDTKTTIKIGLWVGNFSKLIHYKKIEICLSSNGQVTIDLSLCPVSEYDNT